MFWRQHKVFGRKKTRAFASNFFPRPFPVPFSPAFPGPFFIFPPQSRIFNAPRLCYDGFKTIDAAGIFTGAFVNPERRIVMQYGIQLYSVRDVYPGDVPGTLAALAAMGYRFVETAGFHSGPEEFLRHLQAAGLTLSGTHAGWEDLAQRTEETLAFHQALGNRHYIIPGADLSTREKLDQFVRFANEAGPKLQARGIRLGYHNHHLEFLPNQDGQIPFDELLARTALDIELDTFWAFCAGKDPVALMEDLGPRLTFIHIKDGFRAGRVDKPLGQGEAPVAAVYRQALALGVPMVVESESLTPDGLTEARVCAEYMEKLGRA
jgi:sugar phosphate isomerase/epimerase